MPTLLFVLLFSDYYEVLLVDHLLVLIYHAGQCFGSVLER